MKRILTLAAVCLFVFQLNAQTLPQGIAYQAVAVKEGPYSLAGQNAPSIYWSNKDIQVRFTILDKYPSGTSQYSEVHATTTDGFGVFNLIIGQGDVLSGDFTKIPWELGTAHLQVEIDFDNNGSFKLTSLEKFWSVPYAFTTRKSSSTSTDSSLNALNNKYNYLRNRDKDTVIGNEGGVSYASLDSLNQVLLAKLARLDSLNALKKDTLISAWQTNNDTTYTLNTVGVGVNSPVANFHVQNGGFSDLLIESTGSLEDASIWLKNPSKTWRLHGDQNDDNKFKIGLWTDYSEIGGLVDLQYAMTIDTLGNVGIGVSSPIFNGSGINAQPSKLSITSPFAVPLTLQRPAGVNTSIALQNQVDSVYFGINQFGNASIGFDINQASAPLQISSNDNVGIGTATPEVKLDVIGDMRISIGNALRLGGVSSSNNSQYTMHVPNFKGAPTRVSMPFDAGTNRHFEVGYYTNNDENDTWNETLDVNPAKQKVLINDVMNITPRATAPSGPSKGDVYMDDRTNKLMVYDGTTWQACW